MSLSPQAADHHDRMNLVWRTLIAPHMPDWKAEINVFVSYEKMHGIESSSHEVSDAIVHMTATVPAEFLETRDGVRGVRFEADGYRMGPAGDH